jgi:hypothetical protein
VLSTRVLTLSTCTVLSSAETIGASNTGFNTINVRHPTQDALRWRDVAAAAAATSAAAAAGATVATASEAAAGGAHLDLDAVA